MNLISFGKIMDFNLSIDQRELISIIENLTLQVNKADDPSLPNHSNAFSALANAITYQVTGDPQYWQLATSYWEKQLTELSTDCGISLAYGLPSIAWVADVLQLIDGSEGGGNVNEEIDEYLIDVLNSIELDNIEYELLAGLTGIGAYAVSNSKWPIRQKLYRLIEKYLILKATVDKQGERWITPQNSPFLQDAHSANEVNLGFSHGMCGAVSLLAKANYLGWSSSQGKLLLDNAINWLLALRPDTQRFFYPYVYPAIDKPVSPYNSRLGWCYGDLSIAVTLANGGWALQSKQLIGTAIDIALKTLERPDDSFAVNDIYFCHGSTGVAVIYRYLALLSKQDLLNTVANYFLYQSIQNHLKGRHIFTDKEKTPGTSKPSLCLLEGYTGLILSYAYLLNPKFNYLNRLLLLST